MVHIWFILVIFNTSVRIARFIPIGPTVPPPPSLYPSSLIKFIHLVLHRIILTASLFWSVCVFVCLCVCVCVCVSSNFCHFCLFLLTYLCAEIFCIKRDFKYRFIKCLGVIWILLTCIWHLDDYCMILYNIILCYVISRALWSCIYILFFNSIQKVFYC